MDLSGVAAGAFVVGTAGNSFKAVPQFVRTALRGRVAGLSVTAVWLACTSQVLWLSFGVAIEDWRFVALGVTQSVLSTATLIRFVGTTGWRRNRLHAALALPAWVAFALTAAAGSGLILESLGGLLGLVVGAPQLLYLWRRRKEVTDVSGVSQLEYIVVITAQAAWVLYWVVRGHPVAAAGAAWGGAARGATLAMLRHQTHRADDEIRGGAVL